MSQAIILNDILMAAQEIEYEIRSSGLEFEKVKDSMFGEMIVIPASKSVRSISHP